MRVLFAASDKDREQRLARAFAQGLETHGDSAVICHNGALPSLAEFDAVAMVGVKSKAIFEATRRAGRLPIMLDKGYVRNRRAGGRTWEYWRLSVGAHHPTRTTLMATDYPADRFEALELPVRKWRRRGSKVVIAGSSAKYHDFHGLPDPSAYAAGLIEQLHMVTTLPIVYRPKPSWRDARPIPGARYSSPPESLAACLEGAFALVTHGSNACFEAALWGVPSIVLGDAVAAPISSTDLAGLRKPKRETRDQWLANLAYHQWTEDEFASGEAWATISRQIEHVRGDRA